MAVTIFRRNTTHIVLESLTHDYCIKQITLSIQSREEILIYEKNKNKTEEIPFHLDRENTQKDWLSRG